MSRDHLVVGLALFGEVPLSTLTAISAAFLAQHPYAVVLDSSHPISIRLCASLCFATHNPKETIT